MIVMAKQKKAKKKHPPASNPAVLNKKYYLASGRARHLPVYKCIINKGWEEGGLAQICVVRQHVNGHITAGIYLVDTFCAGVKDTFCFFNISEFAFNLRFSFSPTIQQECTYELAHNIIYGAIAFAEEYGISPPSDFHLTRYILEEDTEAVPLIDLAFGRNGKPFLVLSGNPRDEYLRRQMEKNAGPGNYDLLEMAPAALFGGMDDDFEDEEADFEEEGEADDFDAHPELWDKVDWEEFIDEITSGELQEYPDVAAFMYKKTVPMPAAAAPVVAEVLHPRAFAISEAPLPDIVFEQSAAEQEEIKAVYAILYIGDNDLSEAVLKALIKRLKNNTGRWPHNPIFYEYLTDAQLFLKHIQEANATIREGFARFPAYLNARLLYGQLLVHEDRLAEVLPLLEGRYHPATLEPQRETFYMREMVNFYILLCEYFLEKDQLYLANLYFTLLDELRLPPEIPLNFSVIYVLNTAVMKAMKPVLEKARQSEADKQKLISLLLA
jgi:hypothetical protein